MENWISWFQSSEGMGLSFALVLFFLTIFMAAKRWIGLITTIVLLSLSIGIGWAIAHPDELQELIKRFNS